MKNIKKHSLIPTFDNSFVDSSLPTISWSTIGGLLGEPFDQKGVAEKTFNKHFNNPESQYFHKSVDEIIEMWSKKGQESLRYGRMNDEYIGIVLEGTEDDIDMFILDNDPDSDERLANQIKAFDEFIEKMPESWVYVCREKTVYLRVGDFYVKGRFDALFYDTDTNKWVIVDWKTSGTIDTTPTIWTKKLLGAAKQFDEINWNTYTMQTYFYKEAFVKSGYLPEGTTYDDIDVCIVNMNGTVYSDGNRFMAYGPAFEFDADTMDRIYTFGFKKNEILKKRNNG